jgi:hypothetical protein
LEAEALAHAAANPVLRHAGIDSRGGFRIDAVHCAPEIGILYDSHSWLSGFCDRCSIGQSVRATYKTAQPRVAVLLNFY